MNAREVAWMGFGLLIGQVIYWMLRRKFDDLWARLAAGRRSRLGRPSHDDRSNEAAAPPDNGSSSEVPTIGDDLPPPYEDVAHCASTFADCNFPPATVSEDLARNASIQAQGNFYVHAARLRSRGSVLRSLAMLDSELRRQTFHMMFPAEEPKRQALLRSEIRDFLFQQLHLDYVVGVASVLSTKKTEFFPLLGRFILDWERHIGVFQGDADATTWEPHIQCFRRRLWERPIQELGFDEDKARLALGMFLTYCRGGDGRGVIYPRKMFEPLPGNQWVKDALARDREIFVAVAPKNDALTTAQLRDALESRERYLDRLKSENRQPKISSIFLRDNGTLSSAEGFYSVHMTLTVDVTVPRARRA